MKSVGYPIELVPYLNHATPVFYNPSGERAVSPNVVERNHMDLSTWSMEVVKHVNDMKADMAEMSNSMQMLEWIGQTYPDVIAGYKAVKDVERSSV